MHLGRQLQMVMTHPIATLARLGRAARSQLPRIQVTRFYRHDADMPIPDVAGPDEVIIEPLPPTQSDALLDTWHMDPAELRTRLDRGDRCYVATVNGQFVFHGWFQHAGRHTIAPAGRVHTLKSDEGMIYDGFADLGAYRRAMATLKRPADKGKRRRSRGTGICAAMLTRQLHDAHGMGLATIWTYTTEDNVASQRCQLRGGMVPDHEFRALVIGPFVFPLRS